MHARIGVLVLLAALAAGPAVAFEWETAAGEDRVTVVTIDEDSSIRETTAWLVVVEGAGYLRTGSTTWGDNIVRQPRIRLRIREEEHPFAVTFIEDADQRARVVSAFRDKYGWTDALMSPFRGSRPKIMRLDEPPARGPE